MHTDVVHGWREFLARQSWDAFATLTWKHPKRFEGIVKDVRGWLYAWAMLTAEGHGLARRDDRHGWLGWAPKQWGKGRHKPVYVLGIEPHQSGRLHAHALLTFPRRLPDWRRRIGWELWRKHGWSRIEPPRSPEDVTGYVAKYVCKAGSELVISDSFDAARLPGSVFCPVSSRVRHHGLLSFG